MPLGTPKHRATLWVFANAAWIAVSPAAVLYFDRQQRNRAYPVDADSIGPNPAMLQSGFHREASLTTPA
jgi:hypothetical protein